MPAAEPHENEQQRLKALRALGILDTVHEDAYDNIAQLAAELCGTPIAAISLVDEDRQWFKANFGLDVRETPRGMAFCAHAIHKPNEPLVVSDARKDPRFDDNPLVHDSPHIRFYAGVPLVTSEAKMPIGTLCVISDKVMMIDDRQRRTLSMLASHVERLLHLRESSQQLAQRDKLIDASNDAIVTWTSEEGVVSWNTGAEKLFGYGRNEVIGQKPCDVLQVFDEMQQVANGLEVGTDWSGENTFETKSGKLITLSTRLQNVAVNDEESVNLAICRDVTKQRETQRKLERTQRALDTAADAVMWIKADTGDVVYVNNEALRRYQYREDEFLQLNIADIDYAVRAPGALDAVRAKAKREKTILFEATHVRKDGSTYPVEVSSQLIEFDDEEFACTYLRDITERKETERKLLLTQRALDTAEDAVIWARETTGEIVYVNEAACRRYQYSRDEFLTMKIPALHVPARSPEEAAGLFEIAIRKDRYTFETTHVARDGTVIPVEIASHVLDSGDELIRCAFTRDITDRVATQRELEELSAEMKWIFDSLPIGVHTSDPQRIITRVNPAMEGMFGRTADEMCGQSTRMFYANPDDYGFQGKSRYSSTAPVENEPYDVEYIRKDGSTFICRCWGTKLVSSGGEYLGQVALFEDVSERVAAQEKIEELSAELQLIFDAMPLGLVIADSDRRIKRVNPAFEKILGYSPDEAIGQETKFLYANPADFNVQGRLRFNPNAEEKYTPYELQYRRKDGTLLTSETIGTRIQRADGEVIGNLGLIQDISERVAIREQLAAVNEKRGEMLKVLGDSDGVWSWDLETDHVEYAPGFREMLGFAGDDYEGFPNSLEAFRARVHTDDRDELWGGVEASRKEKASFSHEFRLLHFDNSYIWVRVRASFILTNSGKPIRMAGITYDITKWKDAEKERDQFFNAGVQLYGVADLSDATWVKASDNWADVLGYTSDELIGTNYIELAHPEDKSQFLANMKSLGYGVPLLGYLGRMQHKDGSYRWIEFNVSPPEPESSNVYFTANDVTEQNHDLLRRIGDAIPTVLFIFDYQEQRLVFVSRQYEHILGYTPEEIYAMAGEAHMALVHPEDRAKTTAHQHEILSGRDDQTFDIELRTRAKSGDHRLVYSVSRIFKRAADDSVQQVVGTLSLVDDITVLRRYAKELEEANRELESFAYVASHDLKQPLRGIDNLARWIEDDCGEALPKVARKHLDKLQGRVVRMERLLDDLLAYSRIGRSAAIFEDVDAHQLVCDVVELLAAPPEFRFRILGSWPTMRTERVPLEQVFRNLIGNAIKHHNRTDGIITVTGYQDDDCWEFTISDDGPGIARQFHERIFRMFQTLRPRDEVEASGMGLALAKKHVDTRGGRISVESNPETGVTFRFTWPGQPSQ